VLFTPFAIGPLTLNNRLVALPVFTGYALPDGRVSDLLIGHYASLAESGVAMVVVANASVSADGVVAVNNLRIDRDDFIPALARLARAIQQRGALAVLQLNHGGRFAKTGQPLSPSALDTAHIPFNIASLKDFMNFFPLEERFGLTRDFMQRLATWTQPMLAGQREGIVTAFGDAAARACEAGFDALELHGATGYLLTQFLSAFTHKDLSGAALSFSARMHHPVRVVQEVKRRLPAGFPLGFRLLLREWVPGGIDLAEALDFAARLEAEGVSYFSPSVGTYQSMFTPDVRAAMSRLAYLRDDALALKKRVCRPVIVSGRVQTPALAEQLLAEGAGDLIGLGRVLSVDPEWVVKARAGKAVRACRNCYLCLRRIVLDQGFVCVRWSRWRQARTDLEQRLLKRDLYRSLWVAAGSEDLDVLRGPMAAAMIPARPGIRTTVLFLQAADPDPGFDAGGSAFIEWSRAMWDRRGAKAGELTHAVRRLQGPADEEVGAELIQGGYGTVLFARNPAEPWRERFLYRHRAKTVCLLGSHPRWSEALIALDLGLVSLFVLRNLVHTLVPNPVFKFDFIHVLQGKEVEARRRWDEIRRILGWEEQVALRLVPSMGNVAGDILRELRAGGHGTLVMGKRGLSRIKRLFLGSVSAAVLQGLDTQTLILID
jgi:2,4-dienoyl-CoA reductase-like NADH-dependent reductase (Old Yellow Enzyme family)/nucleotide-binding universal stress UspA family protein